MEKDSREKTLLVILNLADVEIRIGIPECTVVRLVQTRYSGVVLGLLEPPCLNEKTACTPNPKDTQPMQIEVGFQVLVRRACGSLKKGPGWPWDQPTPLLGTPLEKGPGQGLTLL